MVSEFTEYFILIGFASVFDIAIAAGKLPPDPITFNDNGLNPEEDVKFLLYSKNYPNKPRQLHIGDTDALSNSDYDTNRPTAFVTHGWKEHGEAVCVPPVRKGFLKHNYNVIVVDWKRIAALPNYPDAAVKVLGIAKYFGKMVDFVVDQGTDPSQMTIAGHSLGGHIAGLAAHNAKSDIGHVVAMDPASPGFTNQTKEGRVDVSDASLVETIHTDIRKLGFPTPIGTIDYFPNGGKFQDGCKDDPKDPDFCAHLRSCLYYGESLTNPDKWFARKCDDSDKFENGECSDEVVVPFARATNQIRRPTGTYYLRTNDNPTFGLGREGI